MSAEPINPTEDLSDFTEYQPLDANVFEALEVSERDPRDAGRWWEDANCQGLSSEVFFPEVGDSSSSATIRKVCGECPVRRQCRRDVMLFEAGTNRDHRHGHWAGLNPSRRWALERRWRVAFGQGPTVEIEDV